MIAVVSPHLDDAVLSVGGLLWLLKDRFQVEVITVFSADPPEAMSPLATTLAGQPGSTISAVRRAEDEHALATLGVGHRHLGFEDAIHRGPPKGGGWWTMSRTCSGLHRTRP